MEKIRWGQTIEGVREVRTRIPEAEQFDFKEERKITLYLEVPLRDSVEGEDSKTINLSTKSLSNICLETIETLRKNLTSENVWQILLPAPQKTGDTPPVTPS